MSVVDSIRMTSSGAAPVITRPSVRVDDLCRRSSKVHREDEPTLPAVKHEMFHCSRFPIEAFAVLLPLALALALAWR